MRDGGRRVRSQVKSKGVLSRAWNLTLHRAVNGVDTFIPPTWYSRILKSFNNRVPALGASSHIVGVRVK